jgi:hypothetical protein
VTLKCMIVRCITLSFRYYAKSVGFIAVRVEWCKTWARSHRWTDEVSLLLKEMQRVVAFYEHKAAWRREHRHGSC